MLYPTIDELTQNKYNRYELALATAKCARLITEEYVHQHDVAERAITGNKETDRPVNAMIDRELRDEKAVKVAINRIHRGDFSIDPNANDSMVVIEADDEEVSEFEIASVLPDEAEIADESENG